MRRGDLEAEHVCMRADHGQRRRERTSCKPGRGLAHVLPSQPSEDPALFPLDLGPLNASAVRHTFLSLKPPSPWYRSSSKLIRSPRKLLRKGTKTGAQASWRVGCSCAVGVTAKEQGPCILSPPVLKSPARCCGTQPLGLRKENSLSPVPELLVYHL